VISKGEDKLDNLEDPGEIDQYAPLYPIQRDMDAFEASSMNSEGLEVHVLRLGHRPVRDVRLTTHVLLAARALGAKGSIYTGERDKGLEESIRRVVDTWGGDFEVVYKKDWREALEAWRRKEGGRPFISRSTGNPSKR
jgi:hypothetical protein